MQNVEVKLRCTEQTLAQVGARAQALGARLAGRLEQVDTYFVAPRGRLKLREIRAAGRAAEAWLIGYGRPDTTGARVSAYEMVPVHDPAALLATLGGPLGVRVRVEKVRAVWLLRHTRIHLDEVRGLGAFVELETVVVGPAGARRADADDDADADGAVDVVAGERELRELVAALGLRLTDGLAGSYADLVEERGA
ncbi:MAG TPA: class IV adenylate cyclase [Ktedonobacterales bacterium]|jgi:adenylate cyclase class IV|nr:class IV adenylate cyclase [Ktedonobacterales bacterium]